MAHPWEGVPLHNYEAHMSLEDVGQLKTLGDIMKKQIGQYPVHTLAILGVAGGNGLEHIDTSRISRVYGIDINEQYLHACRERFSHLGERLCLLRLNLSDEACTLPCADLVVANLLVEYIGVMCFAGHVGKAKPRHVSCVIQKNGEAPFVSHSPYQASLQEISQIHTDISPAELTAALAAAGYALTLTEEYPLPGGKSLLRLDYTASS